ncbi:IS5 family transposase [Bacillus thuringiensis]|uniref:IS5 family transposase n=1 Tax=Bacillus thuringiensis TaxID=1428 RepID=UPI003BFA679B
MIHNYTNNITREQFELIRKDLENARKKTRSRTVNLYKAFCGVLYLLTTGCQWRNLPSDFPHWKTVYAYYQIWRKVDENGTSLLEKVIKKLVETYREQDGREKQTSFCIVDAQIVKNTWIAGEKGYDAGKKVSGIKRHIAVDTNGLIHAIEVTTANITDREGAIQMYKRHTEILDKVTNILCDGGYTGPSFAQSIKEAIDGSVEIIKRTELHKLALLPKCWIVERTFAWLENYRRLWKNCERTLENSRQSWLLAGVAILLKRF